MQIEIEGRATFSPPAQRRIFHAMKETVGEFFRHFNGGPIEKIDLIAFRMIHAGDPRRLIKITTKTPDMGHDPKGVPVVVCGEGKQGVVCLMTVPKHTDEQLQRLVENGPYVRKKKSAKVLETSATLKLLQGGDDSVQPSVETIMEAAKFEPEPVEVPTAPSEPPAPPPTKLTPFEILEANGVGSEEIERLKATLASIIYREVGDMEVPIMLQISVGNITRAIMEHMKLPTNGRGNYQGIIGSFYSSRIALFALKWENSLDSNAQYTDWMFDCVLVLDFIGGSNRLAALTRDRDEEVRAREAEEAAAEENPPPTAEEVEEAAQQGFAADASLLDLAVQMLDGKRRAEEEVRLAEMNASQILGELEALKAKLASTEDSYRSALALVTDAQARVSEYVLSPEVMAKIRAAKARIDSLIKDLGI